MKYEDYKIFSDLHFSDIYSISKEAELVHSSVNQFYDDKPYFYHLNMVVSLIENFGYEVINNENEILSVIFAGYFHDSIEDARLTYNDVKKIALKYMNEFYATMATEIVYALTNEKGRNRHERANDKYYEGIRNTKYASFIKLCDRYANMKYSLDNKSRMYDLYKKELEEFLSKIDSPLQSKTLLNKINEL